MDDGCFKITKEMLDSNCLSIPESTTKVVVTSKEESANLCLDNSFGNIKFVLIPYYRRKGKIFCKEATSGQKIVITYD